MLQYVHALTYLFLQSRDIESSPPAWRSLMIYFGGLTFYAEDPKHFLKIPNVIAARRIAESVLQKYELLESLPAALNLLKRYIRQSLQSLLYDLATILYYIVLSALFQTMLLLINQLLLTVLANLLDQEKDKDIQYILYKKFIYSSLAIAVIEKAIYRDLLYITIVVYKRKDIQKDAQQSL